MVVCAFYASSCSNAWFASLSLFLLGFDRGWVWLCRSALPFFYSSVSASVTPSCVLLASGFFIGTWGCAVDFCSSFFTLLNLPLLWPFCWELQHFVEEGGAPQLKGSMPEDADLRRKFDVIFEKPRIYSQKPDGIYDIGFALCSKGPRLDMFTRWCNMTPRVLSVCNEMSQEEWIR